MMQHVTATPLQPQVRQCGVFDPLTTTTSTMKIAALSRRSDIKINQINRINRFNPIHPFNPFFFDLISFRS